MVINVSPGRWMSRFLLSAVLICPLAPFASAGCLADDLAIEEGGATDTFPFEESLPSVLANESPSSVEIENAISLPAFHTTGSPDEYMPITSEFASRSDTRRAVWGIFDVRGFPVGQQVASNGVEFSQLFLLDLNFNLMLWRQQNLYLFTDTFFWGQKAAPGITNASQGAFDFSKREFDVNLGTAWNYYGRWEGRVFAYSFNNLNRGYSDVRPSGFNDGLGLENRYYLGRTYDYLGTSEFDAARATFLSLGYYPTKSMVDGSGNEFKPSLFARAYVNVNIWKDRIYFFTDVQFITSRPIAPALVNLDVGFAARPFASFPRLEGRLGSLDMFNLRDGDVEPSMYLSIRYVY